MSDTVIVLQEGSILAAEGKCGPIPKITKVRRIPIEGYGDLAEQWSALLSRYAKQEHPEQVRLVLSPIYSNVRVVQIPYATGRKLAKMAENVVTDGFRDKVAGYGIIDADKKDGVCLCCGGLESDNYDHMKELSAADELPVTSVTVPMEGYLRLLAQQKKYRKMTAVFLLFEEGTVTSILLKNGRYHYSTRSRIFSEPGTTDFGTEIVRNLSGIMQFYASQKAEAPITHVVFAGCAEDDFSVALDGIRTLGLTAEHLELGSGYGLPQEEAEQWMLCIGAMITGKKKDWNLNLLKESAQVQVRKNDELLRHLLIPAVTFGVCVVLSIGVTAWNSVTSARIRSLERWMEDETVQSQYTEAEALQKQSDDLRTSMYQAAQTTKNLATYPDLTEEMIREITDAGGSDLTVEIRSMDMDTGTLGFNAVSGNVIDIPGYIKKLQDTGLFSSVDYTGYTYDNDQYALSLVCTLKGIEAGGEQ